MSRILKFRIWDKANKEYMRLGATGLDARNGDIIDYYNEGNRLGGPEEYDVEQYTGLKDKNGKEIYEGDIVEQFVCGVRKFKGKLCGRRTIWQVRWNKEECCFELHYLSGSLFGDSMMADDEDYKIIGNIHESNMEKLDEPY